MTDAIYIDFEALAEKEKETSAAAGWPGVRVHHANIRVDAFRGPPPR